MVVMAMHNKMVKILAPNNFSALSISSMYWYTKVKIHKSKLFNKSLTKKILSGSPKRSAG